MHPDQPGQSPFALTDSSGAGTPFAERPEPPRLGILHLMVLTACVAVWMAIIRTLAVAMEDSAPIPGYDPLLTPAATLYGIGGGGALAGLFLFFARRLRGFRFPVHPGEYLLVFSAISVTLQLGMRPLYQALAHLHILSPASGWFFALFLLATLAVNAAVFIWALVRVKIRRWRIYLLSIPGCFFAGLALSLLTLTIAPPRSISAMIPRILPVAASVVLLVVVIQDHLEGRRYPWSHWMGVALRLWFDSFRMFSFVWMMLSWNRGS